MYKKAAQLALRFHASQGNLTVEQVFKLSATSIEKMLREQYQIIKEQSGEAAELSFLTAKTVDETEQLRFDILKDVYMTKKQQAQEVADAKTAKEELAHLLSIKAKRDEEKLQNISDQDLEARIAAKRAALGK